MVIPDVTWFQLISAFMAIYLYAYVMYLPICFRFSQIMWQIEKPVILTTALSFLSLIIAVIIMGASESKQELIVGDKATADALSTYCIGRKVFNTQEMVSKFPSRLSNPHKKLVYSIACPENCKHNGELKVARYKVKFRNSKK